MLHRYIYLINLHQAHFLYFMIVIGGRVFKKYALSVICSFVVALQSTFSKQHSTTQRWRMDKIEYCVNVSPGSIHRFFQHDLHYFYTFPPFSLFFFVEGTQNETNNKNQQQDR